MTSQAVETTATGRVLVPFALTGNRTYAHKRRFPDWLEPPTACDCCGGPAVFVQNRVLYGQNYGDWPAVYFCLLCEASVGCHRYSVYPLGRMSTPQVRHARQYVHSILDPIWQSGRMTRDQAYWYLAEKMGIPPWKRAHIGEMGLEELTRAAEIIKALAIAEGFGA